MGGPLSHQRRAEETHHRPHPALDLATARKRALEAIGDVAGGKDPAAEKKARKAAAMAKRAADHTRLGRIAASYVERYVKRMPSRCARANLAKPCNNRPRPPTC